MIKYKLYLCCESKDAVFIFSKSKIFKYKKKSNLSEEIIIKI